MKKYDDEKTAQGNLICFDLLKAQMMVLRT